MRGCLDRGKLMEGEVQPVETKLHTEPGHLVTKNDLAAVKVWGLRGVLGGTAIAAGVAVAIACLL